MTPRMKYVSHMHHPKHIQVSDRGTISAVTGKKYCFMFAAGLTDVFATQRNIHLKYSNDFVRVGATHTTHYQQTLITRYQEIYNKNQYLEAKMPKKNFYDQMSATKNTNISAFCITATTLHTIP